MNPHILIVDDDWAIRSAISFALNRTGFRVTEAPNGEEALDLIRQTQGTEESYDLLLTDLEMPRMTGAELISALRQENIPMPTFVISANWDLAVIDELIDQGGCLDFIKKPFELEKLVYRIDQALTDRGIMEMMEMTR